MRTEDHDRVMISPRKGKGEPLVGPDVLMVMIPSELRYLAREAGAEKIPFHDMHLFDLYGAGKGSPASVWLCGPFLGAPHAVMGMEKLVVLGARRIWVLGWCGSLNPKAGIGQLVIPTTAISEEGTSRHYPIADKGLTSDPSLNRLIRQALENQGLSYSLGPVWTTDAPYRETVEKVAAYQAQGVLAVEMEISALMAVAHYRAVHLAGVLIVSDELFDLTWRPGFSDPLLKENSRAAGKVLLDLASAGPPDIDSGKR